MRVGLGPVGLEGLGRSGCRCAGDLGDAMDTARDLMRQAEALPASSPDRAALFDRARQLFDEARRGAAQMTEGYRRSIEESQRRERLYSAVPPLLLGLATVATAAWWR